MSGTDTAAMVPAKYDVIIDGHGYCLLDSLESSIPFRTHRAIYGQTQPFVERQNVSNSYGDNTQDFFLTIRQRDWSLGEQQKFFRAGADGRYWMGSNVDVSIPGQAKLAPAVGALSLAGSVCAGSRFPTTTRIALASTTHLYSVDVDGTLFDQGAHSLGAAPSRYGVCTDGSAVHLTTTSAGTVGVRRIGGAGTFSTFSASGADAIAFVDNTLYGFRLSNSDLVRWDSSGTLTSLFTWNDAAGAAWPPGVGAVLAPYGGKLLIQFSYGQEASELWIYDGTAPTRLEVFPENFVASDLEVLYGVAYISGSFIKALSGSTVTLRPVIFFFDGSQIGKLWEANAFNTSSISLGSNAVGPHPALGILNGRLIFTDDTTSNLMAYDPVLGGVSSIGMFTAGGDSTHIVSSAFCQVHTRNQSTAYLIPSATYPSSGYVISSLVDFDSSLPKQFRGITLEFDVASDGDGGSIDVAYQLNGLTGSWTSLAVGVTSGTEVLFPANTSGHSVAIKTTLNKGTSTAGPTLKSLSVRGAPMMPIYPRGEYILDCTNTVDQPRELRDGSLDPLDGATKTANLVVARNSTAPISVTDRLNGTFTAYVDVNDPEGFDVYEIHPTAFVVRLTVRGI